EHRRNPPGREGARAGALAAALLAGSLGPHAQPRFRHRPRPVQRRGLAQPVPPPGRTSAVGPTGAGVQTVARSGGAQRRHPGGAAL
ncbi:MAG: hypothetical protein AVDCRST_MAG64-426, partial [uncultured Phycisphaerae bacterium]